MSILKSSQEGVAIKLRVKALIPLVVPIVNNLGESYGVNLIPEHLDSLIDAAFLILFAGMEGWGWFRALYRK